MDTEAAVNRGAVDAEKDPKRHRGPCRVLRITIEAHLPRGKNGKPKKFEISMVNS